MMLLGEGDVDGAGAAEASPVTVESEREVDVAGAAETSPVAVDSESPPP